LYVGLCSGGLAPIAAEILLLLLNAILFLPGSDKAIKDCSGKRETAPENKIYFIGMFFVNPAKVKN